MKKILSIAILAFCIFLVGCSTTVGISYMRPSDVDMGHYRNIAIASTVPYKGYLSYPSRVRYLDIYTSNIYISSSYNSSLPNKVADYATSKLVSTLSQTGYYNILNPEKTDRYLSVGSIGYNPSAELLKAGYDAVMIPRIENMGVDEYIWAVPDGFIEDKDGNKWAQYDYFIKRVANITYSLTVVDCKTDRIVAKKLYEDRIVWEDDFDPSFPVFSSDIYYMFRSMINGFSPSILRHFVPSRVVDRLPLMSNKPKLDALKPAYKAAEDGNLAYAYSMFLDSWKEYSHLPSGYNAALIQGALGNYDGAIEILDSIRKVISNSDVEILYNSLVAMKKSTLEAEAQINGTSLNPPEVGGGYSVYDYLLK